MVQSSDSQMMTVNLQKKFLLVTVVFLFFIMVVEAKTKKDYKLEIRGFYGTANFSEFDEYYTDVFSYGFNLQEYKGTAIKNLPGIDIIGGWFVLTDIIIYLRISYYYFENIDIIENSVNKESIIKSTAIFSFLYGAPGIRFYFDLPWDNFMPFLGIDAGIFKHKGSKWDITANPSYPFVSTEYSVQSTEIEGFFSGGNFEIGIDWRIFDCAGISLFGGFRYAIFKLIFPDNGLFANAHYDDTDVDISGFYGGCGIDFYF